MDNKEQSLDRIKLLINYSVEGTLTENINVLQGNILKEDAMGAERWIEYRNKQILNGEDYHNPDPRKQIITIPGIGGDDSPIKVVEGTQYNLFTNTDNSGNLFPGRNLKKDPKYGWYEINGNTKVFYPEDKFWQGLAANGVLKSFKTGPTVSNENGENYHFLINLDEDGWAYATIGYKQSVNKVTRGWKMQPWYYKTEGDSQVPYDESNIDIRNSFDKFWDENGTYIQLIGGLVIGAVTMGIGSVITAAIIAEAGIVAAEGAILASEVATVINAVNTGRRCAFALEVLIEGTTNLAIGMYEKDRGQDPTLSFIFAALPIIKVLPGFSKVFGTLNITQKESDDILKAIEGFDGTNPHIFDALPKKSKEVFEEVTKAANKNPDGFSQLFKDALDAQAKNALKDKKVAKTFIEKTAKLGQGTGKFIKHMSIEASKDIALVTGLTLGVKGINWAWQKLYAAYEDTFNQPMPKEVVKKVNNEVKKLSTEEEKIKYIEELAMAYENQRKTLENPETRKTIGDELAKPSVDMFKKIDNDFADDDAFLESLGSTTTKPTNDTIKNEDGN